MISPEKQALLDQATPRPWTWLPGDVPPAPGFRFGGQSAGWEAGYVSSSQDAALIVAAVNDYERLLRDRAERDVLRRERDDIGPLFVRDMARLAGLPDDATMDAIHDSIKEGLAERDTLREALRNPQKVARMFHETYERLAPDYGYETRKASAVPWEQVPINNRGLMVAVAAEVLAALSAPVAGEEGT